MGVNSGVRRDFTFLSENRKVKIHINEMATSAGRAVIYH